MFWFIVLLLLVGAGFYFYRKMMAIEREIRESQSAETTPASVERTAAASEEGRAGKVPGKVEPPASAPEAAEEKPSTSAPEPGEGAILAEVIRQPGIRQTDLYPLLSGLSRKQAQHLIKDMAAQGLIAREKQGSSYRVYPGENDTTEE